MSIQRIVNKFYRTKSIKFKISKETIGLSYDVWFNNINFTRVWDLKLIEKRAKNWKYANHHKFFIKKLIALSQALKEFNKQNNTNYYIKIRQVAILIEETEMATKQTEGFGLNCRTCNKKQFLRKINDVFKFIE